VPCSPRFRADKRAWAVVFVAVLAGMMGARLLVAAESQAPAKELEKVVSISVEPKEVSLRGENRRQQLLVTAQMAEGQSRDVSHLATLELANGSVARAGGAVVSVGVLSAGHPTNSRWFTRPPMCCRSGRSASDFRVVALVIEA